MAGMENESGVWRREADGRAGREHGPFRVGGLRV